MYAQQIDVQPPPQQVKEATATIALSGNYQFNGEGEANPCSAGEARPSTGRGAGP